MTERHDVRAPKQDVVAPRPKGTVRVRLIVEEWRGESWDSEPDYNATIATITPNDAAGPPWMHQTDSPLQLYLEAVKGVEVPAAPAPDVPACADCGAPENKECHSYCPSQPTA